MAGPPIISTDDRDRSWLVLAAGLVATIALVAGVVQLWPDDDGDASAPVLQDATTTILGEDGGPAIPDTIVPPDLPDGGDTDGGSGGGADLFGGDLVDAMADLTNRAGDPQQVIEIAVYPDYAFLAYRDPDNPGNIDRRMWSDGSVGDADANPIADRVDATTEPKLFSLSELDLSRIPDLVDDAVDHYPMPVEVTHILIDRFLPFDERVLIRVYTTPTDGRSGGGYVTYDPAGTFVSVCC